MLRCNRKIAYVTLPCSVKSRGTVVQLENDIFQPEIQSNLHENCQISDSKIPKIYRRFTVK